MIKVCVAGKNAIALNATKFLLKHYFNANEILAIPNVCDMGVDTWQPSFLKFARENDVRVGTLEEAYAVQNIYFFSLEFDRIVRVERFLSDRLFNVHFSLLPKYKGVYTSIMPILFGERSSGVTLHKIDNGIDTGEIIAQREFKIGLNTSARDLYFKYLRYAFALFCQHVESLLCGDFVSVQQDIMGSYYPRGWLDLTKINIDLQKTSFEIHNQLRAFIFREYQLPTLHGVAVEKSVLSDTFIGYNVFLEDTDKFILSGIDGFKIEAYKVKDALNTAGGGGF